MLIFQTGVSCFSVTLFYFTLFCCGGKANLVRLTLFYSTLLALTDRQNYGETNTLAARGLEGTFSRVVLLCQFLVLAGNRFWYYLLCTYVLRVQYSCGVVLVFGSGGK